MIEFTKLINRFFDLIFSSNCKICDKRLDDERKSCICSFCWSKIELINEPYCKKCGIPLFVEDGIGGICGRCITNKNHFSLARSIGVYDGTLRDAIHLFKYKGKISLANNFMELFKSYFNKNKEFKNIFSGVDFILAVPLHKKKLRKREYNQSLVFTELISEYTGIQVLKNYLNRIKTTLPQSKLLREERFKNVKGVFDVTNYRYFNNKVLLLIDDIFTTGATVNECSKVLLKSGAKEIRVLTISRAII